MSERHRERRRKRERDRGRGKGKERERERKRVRERKGEGRRKGSFCLVFNSAEIKELHANVVSASGVPSKNSPSKNHLARSNAHQLSRSLVRSLALSRLQSRRRSLTPPVGQYDKLHIIHKSISYTVVSRATGDRAVEHTVTVGQALEKLMAVAIGKGKQASPYARARVESGYKYSRRVPI